MAEKNINGNQVLDAEKEIISWRYEIVPENELLTIKIQINYERDTDFR